MPIFSAEKKTTLKKPKLHLILCKCRSLNLHRFWRACVKLQVFLKAQIAFSDAN